MKHTTGDLVDLLHRTQASLREEGTWAERADDLCVIVRPDGSLRIRLMERTPETIDPVFEKAMSLDPHYKYSADVVTDRSV